MASSKGTGVRGRPKSSTRTLVEDCRGVITTADLHRLIAQKAAMSPPQGSLSDSNQVHDVGQSPGLPDVLNVEVVWPGGFREQLALTITSTQPNYGGHRWWFICNQCRRRVGRLYSQGPGDRFSCRYCRRLLYGSQYQPRHPLLAHLKAMRRAAKDIHRIARVWQQLGILSEYFEKGAAEDVLP